MLYRLYAVKDFAALYAIEETCFDHPFRFSAGYLRKLIANPRAAVWIAEEDGVMAGFAIVKWSEEEPGRKIAYIETIEVAPSWRGRGIGGALLRHIEDSALAVEATHIWLHVDAENSPAICLYEAQGYTCESRQEHFYPRGRAALIYAKPLLTGTKNVS